MVRLFGTSGIRRLAEELTDDFVNKLGFSLASYSKDQWIAVGRDTRPSSERLSQVFISALTKAGKDVIDLGVAATPTVAMASEEYGTGVVVTASHNPPEYNGFKFWAHGRAYSPLQEREVEEIFHSGKFVDSQKTGSVEGRDYVEKHIKRIMDKVGRIDKPVRVLLDCANGAGAYITPQLLKEMGCHVISINTKTEGRFAHGLEPTAENLKETCEFVLKNKADIGIVHDGDADRSAAIGRDGRLVDWDSFLAVLAYGNEKVVTTVDASMCIEEVCETVIRTPIGDVAVADAICREHADFGGEPSGSIIFPEVHLFPDGPLTAAKIVKLVSENRFYKVLSQLRRYPVERVKIFYGRDSDPLELMLTIKLRIREDFKEEIREIDEIDGIRVGVDDGWFLVRPSGTEPCIRITSEAKTEELLFDLVERCRKCVEEVI
ncbi:MAG: phosphopentomutase/phosphoglucosamine mutase [Candidatus Altiarchaeota archaeon]|nr:phosphopentomutase/phosphoglucosamine mutase [Candidatus Altiarchaeota archaeon]